MRNILLAVIAGVLFFPLAVVAEDEIHTTTVDKLPKTVEEFEKIKSELEKTAEGTATLLVIAMMTYEKDTALSNKFFAMVLADKHLTADAKGYKDKALTTT